MSDEPVAVAVTGLTAIQAELLTRARSANAGRAELTVYGGHVGLLRQTVLALVADADLAAHQGPPEAILHILVDRVRLGKRVLFHVYRDALRGVAPAARRRGNVGTAGA